MASCSHWRECWRLKICASWVRRMPALKNRLLQITRLFGPTEAPSPELSQAGHPLSGETISGGAYLAARYGLGVLVSVANMLVMTWWIGPHSYGLFVTAIGIVAFLATLARGGIDIYLVRSETPPDFRSYSTATTLILAGSIALS